jgi:hypothetical protein
MRLRAAGISPNAALQADHFGHAAFSSASSLLRTCAAPSRRHHGRHCTLKLKREAHEVFT